MRWTRIAGWHRNVRDEEIGEDQATDTGGSPDEEHLDTESSSLQLGGGGINQVRSGVSDSKVPEPVGGGGHGHSLGSDSEGEDLSNNDPSDRSPGGSKGGNVLRKDAKS